MPIIGIQASSTRQGLARSSYEAIATATCTAQASYMEFSDIPQTYKHLEIVVSGMTSSAGTACDQVSLQVGNTGVDTSANYTFAFFYGSGTSPARANSGAESNLRMGFVPRSGNNNNLRGANIIQLADYANTSKIKTIQVIGGVSNNSSQGLAAWSVGLWNNTAAIKYIRLSTEANWMPGSTATLYGLKDT